MINNDEIIKKILKDIETNSNTFTPLDCDNYRTLLCAWYEKMSQRLAEVDFEYNEEWLKLKEKGITNAEANRRMAITEIGKEKNTLKLGLKAREKMIGALKDRMHRLNQEAYNVH